MTNQVIPAEAVEAAAKMSQALYFSEPWESLSDFLRSERLREAELVLEAAAPYIMADILEDAANTAETDELTTAAEVIYDLRRHAKDLRPANAV